MNGPTQPAPIPFTQAAYDELKRERAELAERRKEVLVRLQAAREMGDLSENGAYTYAKMELGNIGRRQREVRYLLHYGQVQAVPATGSTVAFGRTITLKSDKRELVFQLVSQHESDPGQGKLSLESPIGQAALGKQVGDTIQVQAPAGLITYTIVAIV